MVSDMLSIDINLLFTIINLLILYAIIRKFLYKPVMDIMEQRQQMIEGQFQNAKEAQDKADALRAQWEEELSHAKEQKEEIIADANERAKEEYGRIVMEAKEEAGKMIENANKIIAAQKERTIHDVEGQIAGIAMLAAAKIVNEKSSELDHGAVYDRFLEEKGQENH